MEEGAEIERHTNHLFEFAGTFLGVAIGLCGLAILLRRKWVANLGLAIGFAGIVCTVFAFGYRVSYDRLTVFHEVMPFL